MAKINVYIIGELYGDNNLLMELSTDRSRNQVGKFTCKCGKIFSSRMSDVVKLSIKGCGCLRDHEKTHGLRFHPMYNTYTLVMARCYCITNKLYKYYGGRGISMSDEFKGNPKAFIEYITSLPNYDKRVELGLSLDRTNNDAGYERDNLRWATRKEQRNNRRDSQASNLLILNKVK